MTSTPKQRTVTARPRIGISTCLTGKNVRYDKGHKRDSFLMDTLAPFVEYVEVCPEIECGLGVPREAMRLVGDPDSPRLVTVNTRIDHTPRMQKWIEGRLEELAREDLCGFVFKSKSPSSGLSRVKVYDAAGNPSKSGVGLFARAFTERFARVPAEDEGRLCDSAIRDNFLTRVFSFFRWKQYVASGISRAGLAQFHAQHKLLLMAHYPSGVAAMGRVASGGERDVSKAHAAYLELFLDALGRQATVRRLTNVFDHMMGYFKNVLLADEKRELKEVIEAFRTGRVSRDVPLTLLRHYVRRYDTTYLKQQVFFEPFPDAVSCLSCQ